MKKLFKPGFVMLAAAVALVFYGCENESHIHKYSTKWAGNETHHWHTATCEHSTEISGKEEHTLGNWTVATAATETEKGTEKNACVVCGRMFTRETPVLEHTHKYSDEWAGDGTCHWHDATCGHTTEVSGKAVHTWGEWQTVTAATETEDGSERTSCTVCGKEYTRVIVAIGHSHTIATEWASDDTHHWHEASCGKAEHRGDKASHDWDEGEVTTEPTCTADGTKTFTCSVCNAVKTMIIVATGHSSLDGWKVIRTPTTTISGEKENTCITCKELYRETYSLEIYENLKIDGVTYNKTSEVVIIPQGMTTTVAMTDDTSWSGYVAKSATAYYKGVYIKDRSVTLSPFAMGKYEVTQELFKAVMGVNPSYFKGTSGKEPADGETQNLRPVEYVNWYAAIAFCNKLSILEGLEPCYAVEGVNFETLAYADIPISTSTKWDATVCDFTKKGYRLPTEAEWEYAARGGKDSETWGYSYAGSNTAKATNKFTSSPYNDDALEDYAWYYSNSGYKTHEVGLKQPNSLGLYDMSGNVWEWCWDWYNRVETGTVTDPTGPDAGSLRLLRGGSWYLDAYYCAVSYRLPRHPHDRADNHGFGFRLARSL